MLINLFIRKVSIVTKTIIRMNYSNSSVFRQPIATKNKQTITPDMINTVLASHKHFINRPVRKKK